MDYQTSTSDPLVIPPHPAACCLLAPPMHQLHAPVAPRSAVLPPATTQPALSCLSCADIVPWLEILPECLSICLSVRWTKSRLSARLSVRHAKLQGFAVRPSVVQAKLREAAAQCVPLPSIFRRRRSDEPDALARLNVYVPDWRDLKRGRLHANAAARRLLAGIAESSVSDKARLAAGTAIGKAKTLNPRLGKGAPCTCMVALGVWEGRHLAGSTQPCVCQTGTRSWLGPPKCLSVSLSRLSPWPVQRVELSPVTRQSVQKVTKSKGGMANSTGRTYTSKYRGVHQTFPTKRWEAQFRWTKLETPPPPKKNKNKK
jgi:hypothetical protein